MKTFLTLLAAIISLSAYTLVGVHATCAICPTSMNSVGSWPAHALRTTVSLLASESPSHQLFLFDPGDAYRQSRYSKRGY
jgi:hypothetical protein